MANVTPSTFRCVCPSNDARRCIALRYAGPDDLDPDDRCECACHAAEEDDDAE